MPFYRCRVCQENGREVAAALQISLEERTGAEGWYGTITTDHQTDLQAGHTYHLTLEDGRSGLFKVKRNTMAGDIDRSVAVQGLGTLARGGS